MPRALRLGDERVEGGERAVLVVDVEVVGHVVAVVLLRRRVARIEPDRVDAERFDVVEMTTDAVEIADAVSGRVGERSHVHLVDERVLPPVPSGEDRRGSAIGTAANVGRWSPERSGNGAVQETVIGRRKRSDSADSASTMS